MKLTIDVDTTAYEADHANDKTEWKRDLFSDVLVSALGDVLTAIGNGETHGQIWAGYDNRDSLGVWIAR
jgi:hypothetical protein